MVHIEVVAVVVVVEVTIEEVLVVEVEEAEVHQRGVLSIEYLLLVSFNFDLFFLNFYVIKLPNILT